MSSRETRIQAALRACGAELLRANKHLVYKLPNGRRFTISATPSDHRAEQNKLRDLKHALAAPLQKHQA